MIARWAFPRPEGTAVTESALPDHYPFGAEFWVDLIQIRILERSKTQVRTVGN